MRTSTLTRLVLSLTLLSSCGRRPAVDPARTARAAPITQAAPDPAEALGRLVKGSAVRLDPVLERRDGKPLEAPHLTARAGGETVELALAHTSVSAQVTGNVARVEVLQLYQNPTQDRLEAVYAFPLPENAAVTDMLFRIGNRVVTSEVQRRKEARETYERARAEGKTAALTEEERPNLFTQSVANIPPGASVEVVIRYVHEIPFDDGRYRFVFPTTIGPRYIPAHGVADAARVTPPVVPAGMRAAHDLSLTVELTPADAFADLASGSHRLEAATGEGRTRVTLADGDVVPNKDFVLAWRPAGREPEARVMGGRARDGEYVMLFVQPPVDVAPADVRPRELVFLVDKSGSMMGQPIETAKQLIDRALGGLGPDDTFQVLAFDSETVAMSDHALAPTPDNVRAARAWLDRLQGGGGTEMLAGIQRALDLPADPKRLRMVVFCTDGFIGNEAEIIQHIQEGRGQSRVFGFGIGSSVNRYLIEGVARAGRGAAEYVALGQPVEEAVARLYKRLDRPVLTDVGVSFDGLRVEELLPARLPDLFAGQPLVVVGRLQGTPSADARVTLTGRLGERAWSRELPLVAAKEGGGAVLGVLWARRRIEDLLTRQPYTPAPADVEEVTRLGLAWKLLTPYTSFVAVERELKVDPRLPLTRVLVPNELPEGVSREGIFGDARAVEVSPARIKPGDPEVRVRGAAHDRVLVKLPWDAAARPADWDAARGEHVARFLVPSGWPDGEVHVKVEVTTAGGETQALEQRFTVDTRPASLAVLDAAARGGRLVLEVKPAVSARTLAEAAASGAPDVALKSAMDVKEVLVRAPWREVARARMEGPLGVWRAELAVPSPAPEVAQLEVVAVDTAGNVSRRFVEVRDLGRAPSQAGVPPGLALGLVLVLLAAIGYSLRKVRS